MMPSCKRDGAHFSQTATFRIAVCISVNLLEVAHYLESSRPKSGKQVEEAVVLMAVPLKILS